jgi:hypothetical protein
MVRSAYESGHPSIGVGAGNTPAVIDDTCDIEMVSMAVLLCHTAAAAAAVLVVCTQVPCLLLAMDPSCSNQCCWNCLCRCT